MCLYPRLIENRKYRATKKNGGIIPAVSNDKIRWVPIGCEQCMECRKQKARAWQVRLLEDIKTNTNGKFITLTFSNQSIKEIVTKIKKELYDKLKNQSKMTWRKSVPTGYDLDNTIATYAIRKFLERWRKKYKKSVRHWMVTEIGHKGTENIHLHGIIWTNETGQEIENIWKYGFVWKGYKKNNQIINYVNAQTVTYITKYLHKIDVKHKTFKGKVLTSAGIGNNYTKTFNSTKNKYNGKETQETYRTSTGHTITLPIYYRNKIYTEEEKEKLWINKLDKEERWIDRIKIDISKGYEKYNQILETAQQKNRDLGYGNNNINWKRKKYEEERRKIMQETRIAQQ